MTGDAPPVLAQFDGCVCLQTAETTAVSWDLMWCHGYALKTSMASMTST
jgi:hypothetical protein